MINYEGFYAVVVVCLVILAAIVCCLGIRLFRRSARKDAVDNANLIRPTRRADEWQPLDGITVPIETREDLQQVLGNVYYRELGGIYIIQRMISLMM